MKKTIFTIVAIALSLFMVACDWKALILGNAESETESIVETEASSETETETTEVPESEAEEGKTISTAISVHIDDLEEGVKYKAVVKKTIDAAAVLVDESGTYYKIKGFTVQKGKIYCREGEELVLQVDDSFKEASVDSDETVTDDSGVESETVIAEESETEKYVASDDEEKESTTEKETVVAKETEKETVKETEKETEVAKTEKETETEKEKVTWTVVKKRGMPMNLEYWYITSSDGAYKDVQFMPAGFIDDASLSWCESHFMQLWNAARAKANCGTLSNGSIVSPWADTRINDIEYEIKELGWNFISMDGPVTTNPHMRWQNGKKVSALLSFADQYPEEEVEPHKYRYTVCGENVCYQSCPTRQSFNKFLKGTYGTDIYLTEEELVANLNNGVYDTLLEGDWKTEYGGSCAGLIAKECYTFGDEPAQTLDAYMNSAGHCAVLFSDIYMTGDDTYYNFTRREAATRYWYDEETGYLWNVMIVVIVEDERYVYTEEEMQQMMDEKWDGLSPVYYAKKIFNLKW